MIRLPRICHCLPRALVEITDSHLVAQLNLDNKHNNSHLAVAILLYTYLWNVGPEGCVMR